jgi:hypothetical protein
MSTANDYLDNDDGSDAECGPHPDDVHDDRPGAQRPQKGKKQKGRPAPAPDHRRTTRGTCPALNKLQDLAKMPPNQLRQHSGITETECYRSMVERAIEVLSTGGNDDSRLPRSCGGGQTSFADSSCPGAADDDFLAEARKYDLVLQSTFGINGAARGDGITMWMEVRKQYLGDWGYAAYWIWIAVNKSVTENDHHHPFRCREWQEDCATGEIVALNPATTAMVNLIANRGARRRTAHGCWGPWGSCGIDVDLPCCDELPSVVSLFSSFIFVHAIVQIARRACASRHDGRFFVG